MSAFKQFLSTDIIVSPLVVNKSFSFEGSASLEDNGVIRLLGQNYNKSSSFFNTSASLNYNSSSITIGGLYNSVKQLYYTNYIPNPITGSPYITNFNNVVLENYTGSNTYSRFFNYESTTLFQTNSVGYTSNYGFERYFNTSSNANVWVLFIARDLYGDYINPNTFRAKFENSAGGYYDVIDNGEGLLTTGSSSVGIINYSHGVAVFTNTFVLTNVDDTFYSTNDFTCSFQSSRTIFETQYKCTIRPDEFNFSLNPSLISGSTDGTPYSFVTGSYFSPYVTTVGFYNEAQELLMVVKLGQPLPTSATTDTTILVNIDK